jgi:hypothetical protein
MLGLYTTSPQKFCCLLVNKRRDYLFTIIATKFSRLSVKRILSFNGLATKVLQNLNNHNKTEVKLQGCPEDVNNTMEALIENLL